MWEEIKKIRSDRKTLREFGLTMGVFLAILGGIAMWRGKPAYPYLLGCGIAFAGMGLAWPQALKPLHKIWMAFSILIGFVMSHLILMALFYAVITPIGLALKLFGKDILDQRIDKKKSSYWIDRALETTAKETYENQY